MIRLERFPIVRTLLLACVLGAALNGCASDGRLDLRKLDLSKLQNASWLHWKKQTPPPVAPPATATATPPPAAQTPPARTYTAAQTPLIAPQVKNQPRPRPSHPLAYAKAAAPETKEPAPAKAPQGKVTQSAIPQTVAVLPPGVKAPRAKGKGGYLPDDFIGLDRAGVERLLGPPDLSRKEPFAEVWQYTHGGCVLFLFVYAVDGGAPRVSHAEIEGRDGGGNPDPGQCIGAILARNASAPG